MEITPNCPSNSEQNYRVDGNTLDLAHIAAYRVAVRKHMAQGATPYKAKQAAYNATPTKDMITLTVALMKTDLSFAGIIDKVAKLGVWSRDI